MIKLKIYILKYIIILFELLIFNDLINIGYKNSLISKRNLNNNQSNINYIKRKIHLIIKKLKQNKTNINTLYIKGNMRFGNYFASLNNAIIFCEFSGFKRIIINNSFIKHKIFYQQYNVTIESNNSFINQNNSIILYIGLFFSRIKFTDLGKVNRFYVFRNEIINNLPKVKISFDDLYIYIRGGDIFNRINKTSRFYVQPPLCFYKKIINQFIFRKIFIISEDISNPVSQILLKEYPYIKYNKNDIKLDISYLANSYNIISATSSFIISIIKINQKLKFLWEYDFYIYSERYLHLHHSVYTFSFNYNIYKMNVSENYKKLMYPFHNSEKQRNLMIEEKCNNNFDLIPPRFS